MRSRQVLTAETLNDAISGCDTWVKTKILPGQLSLALLRSARWRKSPASPGQINFLASRWRNRRPEQIDKTKELTKGEAANIITRLKHGAQSRFEKKARAAAKTAKVLAKELLLRQREVVQVGDLPKDHNGA